MATDRIVAEARRGLGTSLQPWTGVVGPVGAAPGLGAGDESAVADGDSFAVQLAFVFSPLIG